MPSIGHYADLKGKRALVTGGSAGIGKATAIALSQQGCKVCVLARRKDRLDAVVAQLQDGFAVVADLKKPEECKRAYAEAISHMHGLDILVNCGGAVDLGMEEATRDGYQVALDLHLLSAISMFDLAIDELVKNRGCVINVSSVAGYAPLPMLPTYSVAKAAQDHYTKNMAYIYAKQGVRVNSVLPGWVETEVFDIFAERTGEDVERLKQNTAGVHALGRNSTADEQAAAIVFLASEAASFITGVNLLVDGGAALMMLGSKGISPDP